MCPPQTLKAMESPEVGSAALFVGAPKIAAGSGGPSPVLAVW